MPRRRLAGILHRALGYAQSMRTAVTCEPAIRERQYRALQTTNGAATSSGTGGQARRRAPTWLCL